MLPITVPISSLDLKDGLSLLKKIELLAFLIFVIATACNYLIHIFPKF